MGFIGNRESRPLSSTRARNGVMAPLRAISASAVAKLHTSGPARGSAHSAEILPGAEVGPNVNVFPSCMKSDFNNM